MEFLETNLERQLRYKCEWDALYKQKGMTALRFEAKWEETSAHLVEVGLPMTKQEEFLAYSAKVGPDAASKMRVD
eukprot:250470-Karenia_brevis.AAC.1